MSFGGKNAIENYGGDKKRHIPSWSNIRLDFSVGANSALSIQSCEEMLNL